MNKLQFTTCLTSVDHNLVLVTDLLVHKKLSDVGSLVTGQLQDLAQLGVDQDGTVALEGLFQRLGNLGDIQIVSEALHGGDALATITLLNADVNFGVVLSGSAVEGI
jgi:hypothetical protein